MTRNMMRKLGTFYFADFFSQGTLVGLSLTSGCVVCYLGEESKSRMLWLGGCGAIICAKLWTIVAMDPDINMLLKDDVLDTEGDSLFSHTRSVFTCTGPFERYKTNSRT